LALVLTALALVPAGAHLFALPNKIGLAQEQYFIVQNSSIAVGRCSASSGSAPCWRISLWR
jgi:hypothetical protein